MSEIDKIVHRCEPSTDTESYDKPVGRRSQKIETDGKDVVVALMDVI